MGCQSPVALTHSYLRARYYDPSTAQFISRDPAVATTRAPYAYVSDNPLNATDPSGEFSSKDVYGILKGTLGRFGPSDYYSVNVGYNTSFGLGVTFGLTLTPDKVYASRGVGFGSPGFSTSVAAGQLIAHRPSACQIDNFVSSYSLQAGGAVPYGVNGVWGNEGGFQPSDFGFEVVGGMKQYGVYQTESFDVGDRDFPSLFFGLPLGVE